MTLATKRLMESPAQRLAGWHRVLGGLALPAVVFALYMGLVWAPEERTLGIVQRIFYFHVGSAWNAYLAFFIVFVMSIAYLVRRKEQLDAMAVSAAEVGIMFTVLTLVTGSFWARAVWNVWWTWEPRLTTTVILLFMYIAYLLIRAATEGVDRRGRLASIFGIVAFANVPLVHFSSTWWRGMHPTVIQLDGPTPRMEMDSRMVVAMLVALAALTLVNAYLFVHRLRLEHMSRDVNALKEKARLEVEN